MLLVLKDDHKEHLQLLISQPVQVIKDFCKLAIEFLRKGPNAKLYQVAADKLECGPEAIRCAVEGLVYLLVESSKHNLTELDFRDSVLTLGFTEEQQETLSLCYAAKKDELQESLSRRSLDVPRYKNLEWRFEVEIASRALLQQITPIVTMQLTLESQNPDGHSDPKVDHITLQTDPVNLVQMSKVLEEAVNEARSQHVRRIQRNFK